MPAYNADYVPLDITCISICSGLKLRVLFVKVFPWGGSHMAMMTAKEYEESLRHLDLTVYMFGERIKNIVDNPIIRPSMNAVAKTYELALSPEHEDLMTAVSHVTGKKNQSVYPHSPECRRPGQKEQNGEAPGP